MRRWDRLTGVLLLAFAGYTMVTAVRLGYWQGRIPGPGFAPIWIGAGLALCALLLLVRRPPAAPRAPARTPELQGIVLRDDGPVAYIVAPGATQARGYRVGEAVGGGVVEAIGARHVVLRTAAGPVELFLDVPKPRAPQ